MQLMMLCIYDIASFVVKDVSQKKQVVSRQFTDQFFNHFTDQAVGIRAEEDNLFPYLAFDIDPSPHPKFGPSPCPIFIT